MIKLLYSLRQHLPQRKWNSGNGDRNSSNLAIGGTITGLTATGLVLQNNAGNDLTVASGATSFTFSTAIATGTAYAVTVKTQPTGLTCTVSSGTGTATANVTTPSITCAAVTFTIGGTITGLTATGLVLQNNAGNDLTVASGAASFTFSTAIAAGTAYAVTDEHTTNWIVLHDKWHRNCNCKCNKCNWHVAFQ
ncbi:MAG: hypothetical protein IPO06_22110 [Leptospiraceae bacterium]|nr:hypothetical protein [Leptospiraceae bacterium]